jgi:diguanylate cyclase (GGDEF)-like protein
MEQVDGVLRMVMLMLASVFGLSWLALGVAFRQNLKYAAHFFVGNWSLGIGVALVAQRSVESNFVTVQIADWLVLGGICVFWSGISLLTRSKHSHWLIRYFPLALEIGATMAVTPDASTYYFRALVFNACAGFTALLAFSDCLKSGDAGVEDVGKGIRLLMAGPFLFAGVLFGSRFFQVVSQLGTGAAGAMAPQPGFTLYLWAFIAVLVVINMSNAGMLAGRLMVRLNTHAIKDDLTACLNRRAILEKLSAFLSRARRHFVPLSCIMFDLDYFKKINDQHGHDAGDSALVHVASIVRAQLRAMDEFGRYGGEEFILLMPDTRLAGAHEAACRMREAIAASFLEFKGVRIPLAASFGVVEFTPGETQESMLKRVDLLMYEAKRAGRNCIRVADACAAAVS